MPTRRKMTLHENLWRRALRSPESGSRRITIFVPYVPPTAVVKLLQYSGLGSNTGMGFHPTNDLHQCLKMVRLLFGFVDLVKNSGGCLFTG